MPCNFPITGYKDRDTGQVKFTADATTFGEGYTLQVPCNQCIGCRLDHARDWSIRMYCESLMHRENSFVTLTYSDENLPDNGSLNYVGDVQPFLKRLRKNSGKQFRFYCAPEYGDITNRPHYHLCLFGIDFHEDRFQWNRRNDRQYYRSNTLEKSWGKGFCDVADFSYGAAAYTAKYVLKKAKGKNAETFYTRLDDETGELVEVEPETARMSKRPAIGKTWFERYAHDVFPTDWIAVNGTKKPTPKYFDKLWQLVNPDGLHQVKKIRRKKAKHYNSEQLETRDRLTRIRHQQKIRNLNQ